jgi:hypothetical protein
MVPKMFMMRPCTEEFCAGDEWSASTDRGRGDLVQNVMDKAEDKFSIQEGPVRKRVIQITIVQNMGSDNADAEFDKAASVVADSYAAQDLAETYGQYQLRALCDIDRFNPGTVTDRTCSMIAAANSIMLHDYYGK